MKKIIVAHPGKQHSYKTAEALYLNGNLFKYFTTVYDKQDWRLIFLRFFLPLNAKLKLYKRKSEILPDEKIELRFVFLGFFLLFFYKLPIKKKYISFVYKIIHDAFGRSVAKYAIRNKVDAVIMFDTTANKCFQILKEKAPQIKRILDVSIANRAFMKFNYEEDIKRTGDDRIKVEQSPLWDNVLLQRNDEEMALSQYFIVASNMSKRSLTFSGIKENTIFRVPYGVDFNRFSFVEKKEPEAPLNLIYVGEISFRKGLHHLCKVVSEMNKEVQLKLVGFYNSNNIIYREFKYCPNIEFMGFVEHENLTNLYQSSDLFVFTTLGEGFGLVVLEALSCGLPCVVSNLAGGDDAIKNGENGFVFEAGNDDDLKKKIMWFVCNKDKIPEMSKKCNAMVKKYTWDNYYKNYNEIINKIYSNEENIITD